MASAFILSMSERLFRWITRMGWAFNKTPLEHLALIASEVGEAVNECRGKQPTPLLGAELADIVLRVMGFAKEQGIDLAAEIEQKMTFNELNGKKPGRDK